MKFSFGTRLSNVRKALKREGLDALILVTVEGNNKNLYYLSGFGGTTGALVVSARGAALAVDSRYTLRARREAKGVSVVEIPSRQSRGKAYSLYIREALTHAGIQAHAKVGFEAERVPHGWVQDWKQEIPGQLISTHHVIERLRQIKDKEEIRALSNAAKRTSDVFVNVVKKIRPGMSERDVARMIDTALLVAGALSPSFTTIVASGKNAAIPHHDTSGKKLRAGESLIMDFGGTFPGGYCSDMTRTVFVPGKKPHPKLLEAYRITLAANKHARTALKPGMMWKKYDSVAREYISQKGYGKFFGHGLGHSVGLETHDPYDYAHDPFMPGTVVSDEPGIYIPELGGVRIEDEVVVTKTGARLLTRAPYLRV